MQKHNQQKITANLSEIRNRFQQVLEEEFELNSVIIKSFQLTDEVSTLDCPDGSSLREVCDPVTGECQLKCVPD